MVYDTRLTEFEWDTGNSDKNYQKHGISIREAEEIFLDEYLLFLSDIKHSQQEDRFIAVGKTIAGKLLFAVFTIRRHYKIRIISVRKANSKEKLHYEEKK